MVPHDPAGLFRALGGRRVALRRLERFFAELNAGTSSAHAFLGNEPNSNAPWLFDWIGRPWRTQEVVRRAILGLFDASPGGFPGNDDLGQMSAWYVFGALGLYPAIPGSDVLAIGSPLFKRTTIRLRRGRVVLVAKRARRKAPYVQSVTLKGRRWSRPWVRVRDIASGARLRFRLGPKANKAWGAAAAQAPPSFGPASGAACRR
jgi:putative alpha-1,2-mannosidase